MNTDNFDAFNRVALHLLVKLFEEFPCYVEVNPKKLGPESKPISEDGSDEDIWKDVKIGEETVSWLTEEGFISVGESTFDGLQLRLSLKGLTVLGYQGPSGPEKSKYANFAANAKAVLSTGTRTAVSEVAKGILTQGLRYLPWTIT